MNVVQVNTSDLVGSRFNGHAIRELLAGQDVESKHLVWTALTGSSQRLHDFPGSRQLNRAIRRLERELSLQSLLHISAFALPLHRIFREADVVHYHIIYDGYFSIAALPFLTRMKPSVWTWHDPWPMTGHCIYPLACKKWQTGCGACPQLGLPFAMKRDRTRLHFKLKDQIYKRSTADVVVASEHMLSMVRASPLAAHFRIHHIPFGIDLERFRPTDPEPARKRLGVLDDRVVIGVRAFDSPFKGLAHFVRALERLQVNQPLCIITTHNKGQFDRFIGKHQIIELGWVDDEDMLHDSYAAVDFFVMPSTAEAFGMMAVECMASGKPVIVFDDTSLPQIAFAPKVAIAVPMGDDEALAHAISRFIDDKTERQERGRIGRALTCEHYDAKDYAARLARLYREVAARGKAKS